MNVNEELKFFVNIKKMFGFFWGVGLRVRVDVNRSEVFVKIQKNNLGGGGGESGGRGSGWI